MNYRQKLKFFGLSFVFIAFLTMPDLALAQDDINQKILDLRRQIEELTKQAEQYTSNINRKQQEADTLQRQIDILNNQIAKLETKISITSREIISSKIQIEGINIQIQDTAREINQEQDTVGELVELVYQRDQENLLSLLLKNPRLSDFANQVQYSQSLNSRLVALLGDLKNQKALLESHQQELENKKSELESLNKKQVSQKTSLDGTKSSKSTILVQTKGQESRYRQLLDDVEKKEQAFFNELKSLEDQAVKSGAFIVHVTASSIPKKGIRFFKSPYDEYYITQGYGMTKYAKRGAYGGAPHNGIDMVAGFGSAIRPIASGSVLASGFNNGWGNWIAILHAGEIVSLYAHMRSPSGLTNTTKVSVNDVIGYEGSTGNTTGSHLHLSIYKDFFTYINPKNGRLYFNYFEGTLNPSDYL